MLVALAAAVDRLGLFQEAVLSCDHALEVDDQYSDTWFIKGLALFRLSQYTESGSCFQMLVEMDHSPAEAWFMKGNCHYHLGEFTIAIRYYEETIRIHRKYPKSLYNMAVALARLGRYEQAEVLLREALDLDPYEVTAWTNPGLCLSRVRHEQEAIACFEKVRELACFVTVRDIVR